MAEIAQHEFRNAIIFSNNLAIEMKSNFQKLLIFLDGFKKIYDKEEKKLPYHINLIDELRANENAHSRILEKLLQQQEPTNKRYEILEGFLLFIIEKYRDKDEFHKIKIEKPEITCERKRIDLWIRDKDYAIVFENKVAQASDQPNQLERYIKITEEEYNFGEEQIYVLYLPPTYEKKPDRQTWGKYYNSNIHKNRYLNLSFKDDILPWLKNSVSPNIRLKDKYLSSSIEQYIDHLEGKFSLRTVNNKMNMELQEFIKKELGLNGIEPGDALKKVLDKEIEMQNALNQLNELEQKIKLEHFSKWEKLLHVDYPNYKVVGNINKPDAYINIGIKINHGEASFSAMIEYSFSSKNIYYGIGRHYATDKKDGTLNFEEIISDLKFDTNYEWWYGWDYTSFQNAYMRLRTLIEKIEKTTKAVKYPNT